MLDIEGEKVAEDQVCQGWIGHLMGWKVYKDEDDWSRHEGNDYGPLSV